MEEFGDFLHSIFLESKQKIYRIAIIDEPKDLENLKIELIEIINDFEFEIEFEIDTYEDISTFTKINKYNFIFVNFVDEFIFDYYLNPRIAKNGYIYSNNEFDLKDYNFDIYSKHIFQKFSKEFLEEDCQKNG